MLWLKTLSITVCFVMFNHESSGQHVELWITGKVVDSQTNQSLPGVFVHAGNQSAFTNDLGRFTILMADSVQYILCTFIGYKDYVIQRADIRDSELLVSLEQNNILLATTVITGSRYEKLLVESPVSISVLKPELLEKNNVTSVDDALDKVSGVQLLDGQANIRGGSGYSYGAGSRVMLLYDDLPILQTDAAFPNWDDLPIESIGQIEILKGASSALYGSAAMNGIIHFRSRAPEEKPYTAITISPKLFLKPNNIAYWWADSNETNPYEIFTSVVHRQKVKKLDITAAAFVYDRLGYRKNHNSTFGRFNAFLKYKQKERLYFTLGFNGIKGKSQNHFYWKEKNSYEGDPSTATSSEKYRFSIDPGFIYYSSKNYKHKFISRYYNVHNNNNDNQSNNSHNIFTEYQVHKSVDRFQLQMVGGITVNYSNVHAQLYGDTSYHYTNLAAFLQIEKKIGSGITLSAGMREEFFRIKGPAKVGMRIIKSVEVESKPVFRLGLVSKLAPLTYLRASWGQGFRFPSIAEKYISTKAGTLTISPNPDLESETGQTFELGVKQGVGAGRWQGFIDGSIFYSRYINMMEFGLNNDIQFQSRNVGDTEIGGCEFELAFQTRWGNCVLTQNGGYTYLIPRFLEFDTVGGKLPINDWASGTQGQQNAANSSSFENILKYRSRHLVRWNADLTIKNWFIGAGVNYNSNIEAIDRLFELEAFIKGVKSFREEHPHGNVVVDFRLGYQARHVGIQCNLDNAFNELYTLRPALLEAPRSLSFRFTYIL